ncbi:hypothetical protein LE190_15660 [Massilia oculi]|uniref:VOC domain-containing protein n=1 Tax=Massilia hydrophila TaxID=3044279 RepID=A0ABS7YCB8_9BURK|nr:VOC family protein [Massilia oculi]MCA1857350.1 hypothetical protein [Massilia oculi]
MEKFRIGGFSEAVVVVTDPAPHFAAWIDVGGWRLRHEGACDPALAAAWGCPGEAGEEWLLGHPDCTNGHVRMVRLAHGAARPQIRADDQCWDSGGLFDLNVRVPEVEAAAAALRLRGWHGAAPPHQWDFGAVNVREWLAKGPDNVRLAVIERVAPPLRGFDHMKSMSQVFNSSQVVRDMEGALVFYCDVLGFRNAYSYAVPTLGPGPNLFGLPSSLAGQVGLQIGIVHPEGTMEGSIELVALTGAQGRDTAHEARPPNTGLAALRLPVRGMDAFAQHLDACGVAPEFGPLPMTMAPYGKVRMLGLRAPDGAWLEFYEPA